MLSGFRVIECIDATINERPKALNRNRLNVPPEVHLLRMPNAIVEVPLLVERVIDLVFVGVDCGRGKYPRRDVRHDGCSCNVRHGYGHDAPFALDHTEHRSLIDPTPNDATTITADVRFVRLNRARHRVVGLLHQFLANQVCHAPCRFVCATDLTFDLLSGDTASCAGHQIHRVEPQVQRCGRLVKDGVGGRVKVVAACRTRPRLALLRCLVPLERAVGVTHWAMGVFAIRRVPLAPKRLKAGIVVGVLTHEFHKRILRLRCFGSNRVLSVDWWHLSNSFVATIITHKSSTVKGYLPVSLVSLGSQRGIKPPARASGMLSPAYLAHAHKVPRKICSDLTQSGLTILKAAQTAGPQPSGLPVENGRAVRSVTPSAVS